MKLEQAKLFDVVLAPSSGCGGDVEEVPRTAIPVVADSWANAIATAEAWGAVLCGGCDDGPCLEAVNAMLISDRLVSASNMIASDKPGELYVVPPTSEDSGVMDRFSNLFPPSSEPNDDHDPGWDDFENDLAEAFGNDDE